MTKRTPDGRSAIASCATLGLTLIDDAAQPTETATLGR
jgi:hypothetical protein